MNGKGKSRDSLQMKGLSKGLGGVDVGSGISDGDITPMDRNLRGWGRIAAGWAFLVLAFLITILALVCVDLAGDSNERGNCEIDICDPQNETRWFCQGPVNDTPFPPYCSPLIYSPLATGSNGTFCYFGLCIYSKIWGPMDPWPCASICSAFPGVGALGCMSMIDDADPMKPYLTATVFCDTDLGTTTCFYHDVCGEYAYIAQALVNISSLSVHSSSVPSLRDGGRGRLGKGKVTSQDVGSQVGSVNVTQILADLMGPNRTFYAWAANHTKHLAGSH